MRNIERVVLWEAPASFCCYVQRAGRGGRDLNLLAEAILIVQPGVKKNGIKEAENREIVEEIALQREAENRGDTEGEIIDAGSHETTDEGGARVERASEDDDDDERIAPGKPPDGEKRKNKGKTKEGFNSHELQYLSLFITTTTCRRVIWDEFFHNSTKGMCSYF